MERDHDRKLLDSEAVDVLRLADRRLRRMQGEENFQLYMIVRRALSALAPVDSMLIGWYSEPGTLSIPFAFRDGEQATPDVVKFGPFSLPGRLESTGQNYQFAEDHGSLLRCEIPGSGRIGRGKSLDAAAVTISDTTNSAVGMLVLEFVRPGVVDSRLLSCANWLGQALWVAMTGADRELLYRDYPQLDSSRMNSALDLAQEVVWELDFFTDLIPRIRQAHDSGESELLGQLLDQLVGQKESLASRTVDLAIDQGTTSGVESLTKREREIAGMISAKYLTNRQIATALTISEKTVKAHVGAILKKLGLRQRAQIGLVTRGPLPSELGANECSVEVD